MDEQVVLSLVLFSILDRMVLITERQRESLFVRTVNKVLNQQSKVDVVAGTTLSLGQRVKVSKSSLSKKETDLCPKSVKKSEDFKPATEREVRSKGFGNPF